MTSNDWSGDATPLEGEGSGFWWGEAPGAAVGHEYLYAITRGR